MLWCLIHPRITFSTGAIVDLNRYAFNSLKRARVKEVRKLVPSNNDSISLLAWIDDDEIRLECSQVVVLSPWRFAKSSAKSEMKLKIKDISIMRNYVISHENCCFATLKSNCTDDSIAMLYTLTPKDLNQDTWLVVGVGSQCLGSFG